MVLKLDVGVPPGKLKNPPNSCMPKRAKMKMNKNSRKRRDRMEDIAFISAITRFRREDQYLKAKLFTSSQISPQQRYIDYDIEGIEI